MWLSSGAIKVLFEFCHTQCQLVSDEKHAVLTDQNESANIAWFCQTCVRTTATMLRHVANLERRLNAIESEREKERHEVTVLENLVKALNKKVNSLEESVKECAEGNQDDINTIREAVTTMLNEIPQTTSIEERFSSIEDSLNQLSTIPSFADNHSVRNSDIHCSVQNSLSTQTISEISTLEISSEMNYRQRRRKNIVLHNVPENGNTNKDTEVVNNVFKEILGEVPEMQQDMKTTKKRIYTLGRQVPGKNRSIKCHLISEETCEQILAQSRLLQDSNDFSNVIIQADLTPMQRFQLKKLTTEKKRRNFCAQENNEEPDWVIRYGKLCRKRDFYN